MRLMVPAASPGGPVIILIITSWPGLSKSKEGTIIGSTALILLLLVQSSYSYIHYHSSGERGSGEIAQTKLGPFPFACSAATKQQRRC